ncbi:MAG: hypothetical protein GY866_12210 [Proteobacteria bacterium]|nr:hypothetical protein [Pseudomonadota bacterium]
MEAIEKTEQKILDNRSAEFIAVWDFLTLNQKKAMKLLIVTGGEGVFVAESLVKLGLKSASTAKKALDALIKKELVNRNESYQIQDVMLKKWVEKKYIV